MMCDSDVRSNQNLRSKNVDSSDSIKKELDVTINIKPEPEECILCSNRESSESYDIHRTNTSASGTVIYEFLFRLTNVRFVETSGNPKHVCKSCCDLINVLEQAELEYIKAKQTFDAIVSKNPLFESHETVGPVELDKIKNEYDPYSMFDVAFKDVDSEDEPLAKSKKRQKVEKRKKKASSSMSKQKTHNKDNKDSWDCQVCGEHGDSGGKLAETAHTLAVHNAESAIILDRCVKEEDGSDNTDYDDIAASLEITYDLDNNSSNYGSRVGIRKRNKNSCLQSVATQKKSCLQNAATQKKKRKKVDKKIMHQCDQCDAKYPTQFRLKRHKESHEAAKPPFICEVCGARYKHKRACDIHVDLHKGISDWKCEECNKLFPSKGALHRHNNIHTGKANYQCDLCGKSFIHTSSFKMHKLAHSGVKPHSCRVCGLALMTRSHLKRHERVHSGEKRHECHVCGKRFSERYNLVAHSKSHSPSALPPEPQPPRRRTFRCPYCHERFERRYMLERHTALAHGRAMERPPPTPRNTMSKLLKAQAQARHPPAPGAPAAPGTTPATPALPAPPPLTPAPAPASRSSPPPPPDAGAEAHVKDDPSPERQTQAAPPKLPSQLVSSSSLVSVAGSWSAPFAAEFALRTDFQH